MLLDSGVCQITWPAVINIQDKYMSSAELIQLYENVNKEDQYFRERTNQSVVCVKLHGLLQYSTLDTNCNAGPVYCTCARLGTYEVNCADEKHMVMLMMTNSDDNENYEKAFC